jgi:hypothetical protein
MSRPTGAAIIAAAGFYIGLAATRAGAARAGREAGGAEFEKPPGEAYEEPCPNHPQFRSATGIQNLVGSTET